MFLLLALLFVGSGFALWSFVHFIMDKRSARTAPAVKPGQADGKSKRPIEDKQGEKIKGGIFMAGNGWLKLAAVSLAGIIISVAALGLFSASSTQMGMNDPMNMSGQSMNSQSADTHQLHVQQGLHGENATGASSMANSQMPSYYSTPNEYFYMQQQLNQMQMQLYQMQQQIGSMNNSQQSTMGMNMM